MKRSNITGRGKNKYRVRNIFERTQRFIFCFAVLDSVFYSLLQLSFILTLTKYFCFLLKQFQTFSELLSQFGSVDVVHTVQTHDTSEVPEGDISYLSEALAEASEKCGTREFQNFARTIRPLSLTLPLLHLHLETVLRAFIDMLNEHTKIDAHTLQHVISLLPSLARDMRSYLAPHLPQLLRALFTLLAQERNDADLLDTLFRSLTWLFKLLHKSLLGHLKALFPHYLPFLAHKKSYIRQFAAESFAFLLRKLSDDQIESHLAALWDSLEEQTTTAQRSHYLDGLALLLFHVVKVPHVSGHICCSFVYSENDETNNRLEEGTPQ